LLNATERQPGEVCAARAAERLCIDRWSKNENKGDSGRANEEV
jgi:hypothetical protein